MMTNMSTRIALTLSAAAFAASLGVTAVYADETVMEKHTEESHSYKVEPVTPPVVERHTTVETVPAPAAVVEKKTTVETVPAAAAVEHRTTETVHTQD